jgi:hypothetical protein
LAPANPVKFFATFFATDEHPSSGVGSCPGDYDSAGKRKHSTPGKGTNTSSRSWWKRARYHRLVRRLGGYHNPAAKKKAIVAIAHTLMVIIWNVRATDTRYADLGPDFYDRRSDPQRETRRLIGTLRLPATP